MTHTVVVDPTEALTADVRELTVDSEFVVRHAANPETATGEADCLVVNHDAVGRGESRSLVESAACSVILVTSDGRDALDEDLLAGHTTLVNRGEGNTEGLLAEKLEGHLRRDSTRPPADELYRGLVESARDGLYRLDAGGHLVHANESWAEMLGYDRKEMLGEHASLAMADGELERGQRIVREVLADDDRESDIADIEMRTKSGDRITVAIHFVVLTTEEGIYDGIMGVARDVTDRRRDKQKLKRQNERLDEFASVVSHDLRNPLNVAQGHLELLAKQTDSDHIQAIDRSLTRMEQLIENLLTLARDGQTVTDLEPVALAPLLEECWQQVATDRATLSVETERRLRADRSRLRQLLENLVRNAVEHGSTSPDSQARQDAVEHGGSEVTVRVGSLPDGFYIADDGPGIPAEHRDSGFENGFSAARDGTGFGLGIAADIAEAHGWEIAATNSADGGARFEITGVDTPT